MALLDKQNMYDFVAPLNMNGLQGRMLRMPSPPNKKREILFVYSQLSSIEWWWRLIQELNRYGAVSVPDLPGFGGMSSLYKIKQKPSLDNLADYLAAFVKLRFKRRRVTVVGLGFGFVVATRMLQRYPEIARKVDLVVSLAGFAHHDDLKQEKPRQLFYKLGAKLFSQRLPAWALRYVFLRPFVLKPVYSHLHRPEAKLTNRDTQLYQKNLYSKIRLWQQSDPRTFMMTVKTVHRFDNCQSRLDLPIWQVGVDSDPYIDNQLVEQHLKVIFNEFHKVTTSVDIYQWQPFTRIKSPPLVLPTKLRRVLARS